MTTRREDTVVASALWAAYGDALGFPTELISPVEFRKRTGLHEMTGSIAWTRRVGGLFGADVQFPRGAYSDDTQLRLCTGRAIRGNGFFDVESFAKIELPVWLNYALGAGRGSKLAAGNLALRDSTWSQNFYRGPKGNYWDGGGNGAAMRIQPHVWASKSLKAQTFIPSVIRDAVCTHGHPRALAGAAIHAVMLAYTIENGVLPAPSQWVEFVEACEMAFISLFEDDELALVWCPNWERLAGVSLAEAFADVKREWLTSCEKASVLCRGTRNEHEAYRSVLDALQGFSPAERGSGLKTPLFAAALAWLFREQNPAVGLLVAANTFGSDTDTIGTMAGALLGAVFGDEPKDEIQDLDYIRSEARRLARIAEGKRESSFNYPDTLSWTAPRAQRDAWISMEDSFALSGLGEVIPFGETFVPEKGSDLEWQWCRTSFDQTVLAKRKPMELPLKQLAKAPSIKPAQQSQPRQLALDQFMSDEFVSIDELTQRCIRSAFNPTIIGECLLALSIGPEGVERSIAFAAIIAKARLARRR